MQQFHKFYYLTFICFILLSDIETSGNKTCETVASGWLIYLNCMMMHRPANVKCTHQLLVCADDVSILDESEYTIKKNTEAVVVASKETCLEVNVEKTMYMGMS